MNKPILLLKFELLKPIAQALERIEKIKHRKVHNDDSIILEGLFALAVSSFENSLNDTLRVLLTNIPDKLDIKNENITKRELIEGNPLKQTIENKVISIGFKSLPDIINYFTTITNINSSLISDKELNALLEIKATRNLLIHNNLIVNNFYFQTAGPNKRDPLDSGGKIIVNQEYLFQSLITIRNILNKFLNELSIKYADYTKIRAVKELFNYIFKTPLLNFENEFDVDEENDVISYRKPSTSITSLSDSERFYFDVWLAHTYGRKFEFNSGQFFTINDKEKFMFFMNNINLLKT